MQLNTRDVHSVVLMILRIYVTIVVFQYTWARCMFANRATQLHDGSFLAPRFVYPNDRRHPVQGLFLFIAVTQPRLIFQGIARDLHEGGCAPICSLHRHTNTTGCQSAGPHTNRDTRYPVKV